MFLFLKKPTSNILTSLQRDVWCTTFTLAPRPAAPLSCRRLRRMKRFKSPRKTHQSFVSRMEIGFGLRHGAGPSRPRQVLATLNQDMYFFPFILAIGTTLVAHA